ncbi:MAG: hypothetical protein WA632_05440 [Gallionella sp.]
MKRIFLGSVATLMLAIVGCSPATRYFNPSVSNTQRDRDYQYCTQRVPLGIKRASEVSRIPDLNNDEFDLDVARCMKSKGYAVDYQGVIME